MASAWDNFWSDIDNKWNGRLTSQGGQQPNSSAAKWDKLFSGGQRFGESFKQNISDPVSKALYNPERARQADDALNRNLSNRPLSASNIKGANANFGPKAPQEESYLSGGESAPQTDEFDDLSAKRAALEAMLLEEYTNDGVTDGMIDEAYAGAFDNINKARGRANDNFARSDRNIEALTAGHVNTIKNEDLAAVKRIGGDLQGSYDKTFDTARNQLTADRDSELRAKTEMLQRLGIQEAGLGEAGAVQSGGLERLAENQARATQQAQGYQAADETRNTELAASQAGAGVERRSALNKDLQSILGTIDDSESSVRNSVAQAKLQGQQQGRADFRDRQRFNMESLTGIDDKIQARRDREVDLQMEQQKMSQKAPSNVGGGILNAVGESLRNNGIEPDEYINAYAEARTGSFNSAAQGDKTNWLLNEMKKKAAAKGIKLDDRAALSVILGVEQAGSNSLNK